MRPILFLLCLSLRSFVAPAGAVTLSGHVTDVLGRGVSPATVEVRDSRTGALLVTPGNATNTSGNYSLDVPAGRYDVTVLPDVSLRLLGETRGGVRLDAATTLNVQLAAGSLLTGRLVGPGGTPVPHVTLRFESPGTGLPAPAVLNAVTDEQGRVNVVVTPGTWAVAALPRSDQPYAPRRLGVYDLATDRSLGELALQPGLLVTGRIRDAFGALLAGAEFLATDAANGEEVFVWPATTNALGVAAFRVPTGRYDFIACPPSGPAQSSRTARGVLVGGDLALPDLSLGAGLNLFARCTDASGAAVTGVTCRLDSLPGGGELGTAHHSSDSGGGVFVLGAPGPFRVSFVPPVASRLLPIVFDRLELAGDLDLGTLVHGVGHWLSVVVRDAATHAPLAGARVSLARAATGEPVPVPAPFTDASGSMRATCDTGLYRITVAPPSGEWIATTLTSFRSLSDTTAVVELQRPGLSVAPPARHDAGLRVGNPSPNPVRGGRAVTVHLMLAQPADLRAELFDALGRLVATGAVGHFAAGPGRIEWPLPELAAGRYVLRVRDSHGEQGVGRLVVVR